MMNMSEMNKLIETCKNSIPVGKAKSVIMKTCMKIRGIIMNFQFTDKLLEDFAEFDRKFYGYIRDDWVEKFPFYTVDDPHDVFDELFGDFRFAAHRIIAAVERSSDKNTRENYESTMNMVEGDIENIVASTE